MSTRREFYSGKRKKILNALALYVVCVYGQSGRERIFQNCIMKKKRERVSRKINEIKNEMNEYSSFVFRLKGKKIQEIRGPLK